MSETRENTLEMTNFHEEWKQADNNKKSKLTEDELAKTNQSILEFRKKLNKFIIS